jgi:hypothetical protein
MNLVTLFAGFALSLSGFVSQEKGGSEENPHS